METILSSLISLGVIIAGAVEIGPGVCQYDLIVEDTVQRVVTTCPTEESITSHRN